MLSVADPVNVVPQQFGDPAAPTEGQLGNGYPGHAERLLASGLCPGCSSHNLHRHRLHLLHPPAGECLSDATATKLAN